MTVENVRIKGRLKNRAVHLTAERQPVNGGWVLAEDTLLREGGTGSEDAVFMSGD